MSGAGELLLRLLGGAGIFAALTVFLWDWDKRLLGDVVRALPRSLQAGRRPGPDETAALSEQVLRSSIGPRPVGALALHVLWSSLAAMLLLAIFYFMTIPDHLAAFFGSWESVRRFLVIFMLNGLTTVFLVGYVSAAVMGPLVPRIAAAGPWGVLRFILFDLGVKLLALLAVTAAEYVLFARLGGSFGGSWRTALGVIPETLALALQVKNLASVYVYAALLGGFPLFVVLLVKLSGRYVAFPLFWQRLGRLFPLDDKPVRYFGILLAIFAAAAAVVASLVLQSAARAAGL
jgi:hypothetical protein